jgi:eukaryotic-like serine/threonine-protein kinase
MTVSNADRQKELESIARKGSLIAKKYRVEGIIGHGGMGAVVAATHRRLGQRVAIKILYPSSARSPEAVARFLREAQAAAALQSEHVVRILDFGRHTDGLPFMVMEYLVGTNLAQLLAARGKLPLDEALQYVMQGTEAVAEAHARGIIHRDIKPANLFLTCRSDGSPLIKVLDFGISKADWLVGNPNYTPDLTATADTLGTPMYMSPEQVRSTKDVTARADIWAFGVMLYELLVGTPPFWADSLPALSAKIVADTPVPLSHHRNDLPDGLDAAVMWCLEKDPARRPPTVAHLARLLAPFAPGTTHGWPQRIDHIVQQARVPNPNAARPSIPVLEEVPHAWGQTQSLRRNIRGGLLGLAFGASAALVAGGIWWLATTRGSPKTLASSAPTTSQASPQASSEASAGRPSGSARADGVASVASLGSDAGIEGSSPAKVSSADAPRSAAPPPRTGAPRSDPLGDRY